MHHHLRIRHETHTDQLHRNLIVTPHKLRVACSLVLVSNFESAVESLHVLVGDAHVKGLDQNVGVLKQCGLSNFALGIVLGEDNFGVPSQKYQK